MSGGMSGGMSGERVSAQPLARIGDWYTQPEVCELLEIAPATVRRWVTAGRLERRRGDGRNLYRQNAHREPLTVHERPTAHKTLTVHERPTAHQPRIAPPPGAECELAKLTLAHRDVLALNGQLAEEVDELAADNARLRAELEAMTATLQRSDRLVDLATQLVMQARGL